MPGLLKHLIAVGFALPLSITTYHAIAAGPNSSIAPTSLADSLTDLALGKGYDLSELAVLQRDLWWVETRYVERERLDPEAMFQAALDVVERQVPEVMFQREVGGRRLHISVGSYSTILLLEPIDDANALHGQLQRVAAILEDHLDPDDHDHRMVEYGFINGALSTLDPHSLLMPPEASREMDVENQGEFGGLGIEITSKDGKLIVKNPMEGTPAFHAGLKTEDHIVRIEDESTINMDLSDAVSKLRGPIGTPVNIKIMRAGLSAPKAVTIVRDKIKINMVEGELLDGNIGYVKIKNFHQYAAQDLEAHLAKFRRDNGNKPPRGLILDLRSNPGGYLTQAVDVSNKFLRDGVIVSTVEGAGDARHENRASGAHTEPDYPIAVLVNATSASASEIVAGALRNHDRAIIIGERTFGKGSVQHLYNNNDDSRLKLTVAKYLTPGDQSIQSVGISPDILVQPSVVEVDPEAGPRVSLYYRENVDREAELDHHLARVESFSSEPAYAVRYLRSEDDAPSPRPDPARDWEVKFAQDVLLQAPSARRVDVLRGASGVVARVKTKEAQRIQQAFSDASIDWTPGPTPQEVLLDVSLDLGDDGVLIAGEEEDVTVSVTNLSDTPIHQLSATTSSGNAWLDGREFYFGLVPPGESRSFTQPIALQYGYGEAVSEWELAFRTPDSADLMVVEQPVASRGMDLPQLAYDVTFVDSGDGLVGNGNGLPEAGEVVGLDVTVTNRGSGPTQEAFVRIKNHTGKHLDLRQGVIEVGVPRQDGQACEPDTAGCERILRPGESVTGRLVFELRDEPTEGRWDVELLVGDARAYDYASIQGGGFFDYFQLEEKLSLATDQPLESWERQAPLIDVTRSPAVTSADSNVVISGLVEDDNGLRDVIIYHGDDKVFYQGGAPGVAAIPFTSERRLEVGENLFVILARDENGLSATRAVRTWLEETEVKADKTPPVTASSG